MRLRLKTVWTKENTNCYQKIQQLPLKSDVQNSGHFVALLRLITINANYKLVSFDVEFPHQYSNRRVPQSYPWQTKQGHSIVNSNPTTTGGGDGISGGVSSQLLFSTERHCFQTVFDGHVTNFYIDWFEEYAMTPLNINTSSGCDMWKIVIISIGLSV